jgi:hypothetical protein
MAKSKKQKHDAARERAFDQVRAGQHPSLKGTGDLGIVHVHDPFELAEVIDGKRDPKDAKPRAKLTNLRDDPVGLLHRRGQVSDLQLAGARTWQAYHDAAAIGGARAIDPAREKVDGGKIADPNTDVRLAAMKALAKIDARLGAEGAMLVRRVLGEAMEIQRVAAVMGDVSEPGRKYVGRRLRECLDTIVDAIGLQAEGARPRTLRDVHAEMAQVARSPELHRAARRAKVS